MASNSSPPSPDYARTAREYISSPAVALVYAVLALNQTLRDFLNAALEEDTRDQP